MWILGSKIGLRSLERKLMRQVIIKVSKAKVSAFSVPGVYSEGTTLRRMLQQLQTLPICLDELWRLIRWGWEYDEMPINVLIVAGKNHRMLDRECPCEAGLKNLLFNGSEDFSSAIKESMSVDNPIESIMQLRLIPRPGTTTLEKTINSQPPPPAKKEKHQIHYSTIRHLLPPPHFLQQPLRSDLRSLGQRQHVGASDSSSFPAGANRPGGKVHPIPFHSRRWSEGRKCFVWSSNKNLLFHVTVWEIFCFMSRNDGAGYLFFWFPSCARLMSSCRELIVLVKGISNVTETFGKWWGVVFLFI